MQIKPRQLRIPTLFDKQHDFIDEAQYTLCPLLNRKLKSIKTVTQSLAI